MSTGIFFTSSSFITLLMQDRCENTDRKSNERRAEKGRAIWFLSKYVIKTKQVF